MTLYNFVLICKQYPYVGTSKLLMVASYVVKHVFILPFVDSPFYLRLSAFVYE